MLSDGDGDRLGYRINIKSLFDLAFVVAIPFNSYGGLTCIDVVRITHGVILVNNQRFLSVPYSNIWTNFFARIGIGLIVNGDVVV